MRGLIVLGASMALFAAAAAAAQAVVLVDQTPQANVTVPVVPSFDATGTAADNQAADDFTVPDGRAYAVQSVDVVGKAVSGSGTDTATVTIYADASGPGSPVFTQAGIALNGGTCSAPNNCDFQAPLSGAPSLGPGNYWISVQTSGPFTWWWAATPPQAPLGAAAVWQNPGNSSGRNCFSFQSVANCGWTTASDGTDLIYVLNGTVADSRFSFGEFSSKGLKLFIDANFPAAGSFALKGKGLKPSAKSVSAGNQKLRLKLKKGVERKLARGKKAKVRVDGTFTATGGGPPYTQTATVKLIPSRTLAARAALRLR